jgi:hypothetical protein
MEKKKPISEKSLIENCILRSKFIITAQAAVISNNQLSSFCNRLPTKSLTSLGSVKELKIELDILIDGFKRDIANLLRPIFHANNIAMDLNEDKFWFSSKDLETGYVKLSTKEMKRFEVYDRVLLLSKVNHEGKTYSAGSIITWMKFNEIQESVHGIIGDEIFILRQAIRKTRRNGKKEN